MRQLQKKQYDKHIKDSPELQTGQNVRMKKPPNEKYWQFRTSIQSLWNRSYLVNIDGKDMGRQTVEIGGKFDQLRRLMMWTKHILYPTRWKMSRS